MRQLIVYLLLVLFAFLALGSCTNNEGSSDLDIITPNDSLVGKTEIRAIGS